MNTGRGLFSSALIGALDQAMLSAFSLALGLVFIRLAPKTEYAVYVLLTTLLLLAQSLQNALVSSPLTTLWPGHTYVAARRRIIAAALRVQGWLVLAVVAVGAAWALVDVLGGRERGPPIAAMVLAGIGVLSREFVRARFFLQQKAMRALLSDLLYVVVAAIAVAVLIWVGQVHAGPVLAAVGVAGLAAGLVSGLRQRWPFATLSAEDRVGLGELWACARWALPSVVSSWLYANAFLFIVDAMLSAEAVADVAAARLLLVPLSLLVVGWSNAFRPRASAWLAAGAAHRVERTTWRSAGALLTVSMAYGGLLYLAMPLLQAHVLGRNYLGLDALVLGWLAYFAVSAMRNVGMSAMLASPHAFKPLFAYGVLALAVALPGVALACAGGSRIGVLVALTLAELALAALIWIHGWPRLRRRAGVGAT